MVNYSTTYKGLPLMHYTIREVHRNNLSKAYASKVWQEYVDE